MNTPKVSFVIPCYKLAHLLPQCIESILSQTYGDFEVLVLDDCSPDDTATAVSAFRDPRIKYIRNEHNLGPLRNYNKGITLSRGEYVWLISADDYLRRPYVLERYVELMDASPNVGYAFCPGIAVRNGRELDVLSYSVLGNSDRIFNGCDLLAQLLDGNPIIAASAMVRRNCYSNISLFPLDVVWADIPIDLVWGGDWYLWSVFALSYDAAYFAEPMVCYREHELSMTNTVTQDKNVANCWAAELGVLWMVRQKALENGLPHIARMCAHAIAREYARHSISKEYRWLDNSSISSITPEQIESTLCRSTPSERERNWIRARYFAAIADELYARERIPSAREMYLRSLAFAPTLLKVYLKLLLLLLGRPGAHVRSRLKAYSSRMKQSTSQIS